MKPEYDFTNAERGKFFHPDIEIRLPVYLDEDVQSHLMKRAARECKSLSDIVNGLLRQGIQTIEPLKNVMEQPKTSSSLSLGRPDLVFVAKDRPNLASHYKPIWNNPTHDADLGSR